MIGKMIEWVSRPIEGPLTNFMGSTLRLAYQRGLFDGVVAGVLVTILMILRWRRCDK